MTTTGKARALFVSVLTLAALTLSVAPASATSYFFESPSGNIGCYLDSSYGARCDVRVHTWAQPALAGCNLDWGDSLYVGRSGKAKWTCHGDTTFGGGGVLDYGYQVRAGRYQCTSKTSGMRCVNTRTGHGFLISKSKHVRF